MLHVGADGVGAARAVQVALVGLGKKARRAVNFVNVHDRLAFHNGAQSDVEHLIHHILRRIIKG